MSRLADHQNVFRIAKHDAINIPAEPRTTKRNRQHVSCLACRERKLKCSRQTPCLSCSKRGDAASCIYSNQGGSHGRNSRKEGWRASEAQIRLQKLEEMVTALIQTTEGASQRSSRNMAAQNETEDQRSENLPLKCPPQTLDTSPQGRLDICGSETNYLGATHWATILENIREIQGVLETDVGDNEEFITTAPLIGPDIILDRTQPLTLTEVYNSLPPRAQVNKLLSMYFNNRFLQIRKSITPDLKPLLTYKAIIHSAKFEREYESFWVDPSSVSFLWLSILFSALHLGSQVSQAKGQEVVDFLDSSARPDFLTIAGQTLIAGKYNKARLYSVEATLLYAICRYGQKEDPDMDAWMIMGITARLALRMGYHRDPRHFPKISPFEGEMRRRTFSLIKNFELLLSFQAGLPAIIHEEECDSDNPRNLFDSDFNENCEVLPPSRPPTDPTPMLYFCCKSRLVSTFRRVIRHAMSITPPLYEETMKLDGELHEIHRNIPPSLRIRPLASSFTDEAYNIMNRLNIELVYLKSLCVLHRYYLSHERSNPKFDYSRKVCTDAAFQVLNYQAELHIACQVDGQFYNDKWVLSSLTMQDFLLAAMICCLDLYESHNKLATTSEDNSQDQVKKYDALRFCHGIWVSRRAVSRDARRASNILAAMLLKVPRPNIPPSSMDTSQEMSTVLQTTMNELETIGTAINSLGSWSVTEFDVPSQGIPLNNYGLSDPNATNPLNTIFSESNDIDWGLIDQCLIGRSGSDDAPFDWDSANNRDNMNMSYH